MRHRLLSVVLIALLAGISFGATSARRMLNRTVPDLKMTGVAVADAIDSLRDLTGANLHVNWRALEEQGIGKDTPVNVHVRAVTVEKALNLILSEAGAGDRLAYYVDQGVIEITTREVADRQMVMRVYPVDDLLLEIPDFVGPAMDLNSAQQSSAGRGGGGGGSGVFGGSSTTENKDKAQAKAERADSLVQLITETVRPEVWRQNGGPASIRYFGGNLIVTAPRSVQEALGGAID